MNGGLARILTLTFGKEGNETNHLGSGWSGDEPGHRWMIGQASELWLSEITPDPDHTEPADLILELDIEGIAGSNQKLLIAVRDQAIAQITRSHGGTLGFHIPGRLATGSGPVRLLLVHPDFRRPSGTLGADDRELSLSVRALRLSRLHPRPAPIGGPPLPPAEMITRFESIGDNCEFGLVQRKLNAEPLGLFRFSFIELASLLRGLRDGFEGMGDPATTELVVDGPDREYVVRESVYNTTYHTFQYESQIDIETVRAQQSTRLRFLRRKFLEDLGNGEKILVIKRLDPLPPEEVLPIYVALNELGWNWLLWMLPADDAHPSGTVEMLLPGLLRAYIDRFAPYDNAHDISLPAWVGVCEKVWRAIGQPIRA